MKKEKRKVHITFGEGVRAVGLGVVAGGITGVRIIGIRGGWLPPGGVVDSVVGIALGGALGIDARGQKERVELRRRGGKRR